MRRLQPARELRAEAGGPVGRDRAGLGQGAAGDVLHDDPLVLVVEGVVDGDHVGVVDAREDARFAAELRGRGGAAAEQRPLQRDGPVVQLQIRSAPDLPVAARAQAPLEPIPSAHDLPGAQSRLRSLEALNRTPCVTGINSSATGRSGRMRRIGCARTLRRGALL